MLFPGDVHSSGAPEATDHPRHRQGQRSQRQHTQVRRHLLVE